MDRIAVFASGGGSNLEALLDAFADRADGRIALVASDRASAGALERGRQRGVATAVVDPGDAGGMLDLLAEHAIDWVVLAGYLRRVPVAVVEQYRNRILNIHPALLPRFGGKGMYGLNVHRAVLAAGERESGVTVHVVDDQYDHGHVLAQRRVAVEPDDTPERLAERILAVEHQLLPAVVVAAVEGRLKVEGPRAWIDGGVE